MKLAEALTERSAVRKSMEDLKQRIYRNALTQEGQPPAEDPQLLLRELQVQVDRFSTLVTRINQVNAQAHLPDGQPLLEALARRDMMHLLQQIFENLATKAVPDQDRYSRREIRMVATVDVAQILRTRDEISRQRRLLDLTLQQTNWSLDL